MQQNQETQQNAANGGKKDSTEEKQANTHSEVREGQENSSILHDQADDMAELSGPLNPDMSSTSQEEYIHNDVNVNTTTEKE